jgi:hypothetical protein
MAQPQGNSSTNGGRIDGSIGTAAVAATHFAIGVGWGGAATISVAAGSNAQRGSCTITASVTTPAQATATVVYTFPDGAFAATPVAMVQLTANTNAITEAQPMSQACTTTALSWTHSVLPVATKTYTFTWYVIA